MSELGVRHFIPAFGFALLAHGAFFIAPQWNPDPPGAASHGVGGISISLGSAGGARGRTAPVEPDTVNDVPPETRSNEVPSLEAEIEPNVVEEVAVADVVEAETPEMADAQLIEAEQIVDATVEPDEAVVEDVALEETRPVEVEPVENEPPAPEAIQEELEEQTLIEVVENAVVEAEPSEVAEVQNAVEEFVEATSEPKHVIEVSVPNPRPPVRPKTTAQRVGHKEKLTSQQVQPIDTFSEVRLDVADHTKPKMIQTATLSAGDKAEIEQDTRGNGTVGLSGSSANTGDAESNTSGGNPGVKIDYMTQLAAILSRHKRYPRRAQSRRQQGIGELQFIVDERGNIVTYTLHRSSGYSLLDKEIMALLERVGQFPPIPDDMGVAQVEVIVPVSFSLR